MTNPSPLSFTEIEFDVNDALGVVLVNPLDVLSDATNVCVVMCPGTEYADFDTTSKRWDPEYQGFIFVRHYDEPAISRQTIVDFVCEVLDTMQCDLIAFDEFGYYWMENEILSGLEYVTIDNSGTKCLVVVPVFTTDDEAEDQGEEV